MMSDKHSISAFPQKVNRFECLYPQQWEYVSGVEKHRCDEDSASGSHIAPVQNVVDDSRSSSLCGENGPHPARSSIITMNTIFSEVRAWSSSTLSSVIDVEDVTHNPLSNSVNENAGSNLNAIDSQRTPRPIQEHKCIRTVNEPSTVVPPTKMQGSSCSKNQNDNADRRVRFQRHLGAATAVYTERLAPSSANESSNNPAGSQNQATSKNRKESTRYRQRGSSQVSSDPEELAVESKSKKKSFHDRCKYSIYTNLSKDIPKREKPNKNVTPEEVVRKPVAPSVTPTSKFHEYCQRPTLETTQKRSTQDVVPYGGPRHNYMCPKRSVTNLYESRMTERAFVSGYRRMLRKYYMNFCHRCSVIYADGMCRHELGCKSYRAGKQKSRGKGDKKSQSHKEEAEVQECTCSHTRECHPKEDITGGSLPYEFEVQVNDSERMRCTITVNPRPETSEEEYIRLLIVEVDMINPLPQERKLSVPLNQDPFSDMFDGNALEPVDTIENDFRLKKEIVPKISSSTDTVKDPGVAEKLGNFGQFPRLTAKIVKLSVEERDDEPEEVANTIQDTEETQISWNDHSKQFGCPVILRGRMVTDACFCPRDPIMLLTIHRKIDHSRDNAPCKLLCLWNSHDVGKPSRILGEAEDITCMCFSPVSSAFAFAGMSNGSIAIWDTEKHTSKQTVLKVKGQRFACYAPFFSTPHGDESKGHVSPVLSIVGIKPQETFSDEKPQAMATVEAAGVIIIWQVEKSHPERQSSLTSRFIRDSDDVLRLKMVKILQISLTQQSLESEKDILLGTLILQLNSLAKMKRLGAESTGGGRTVTNVQYHAGAVIGKSLQMQCVDFSPFNANFVLVGYHNGRVFLCHQAKKKPILCFDHEPDDKKPIVKVEWSPSRPAVFFVLQKDSDFRIYDLLKSTKKPTYTVKCENGAFISMALSPYDRSSSPQFQPGPLTLVLSTTNGKTEIYSLNEYISIPWSQHESRFLKKLAEKVPKSRLPALPVS